MRPPAAVAALLLVAAAAPLLLVAAAAPLRFWNLTNETVTSLRLAPAGTTAFGADECALDPDGEVDHNERLNLPGVAPGRYDVQVGLKGGRVCTVRGVELRAEGKYAFSLEPSDLSDCR